jgi:hypothetical protein
LLLLILLLLLLLLRGFVVVVLEVIESQFFAQLLGCRTECGPGCRVAGVALS